METQNYFKNKHKEDDETRGKIKTERLERASILKTFKIVKDCYKMKY